MSFRICVSCWLLMLALSGTAVVAQSQTAAQSKDAAAIRAHIESIFQAFIDGDEQKIFDTHSNDWRGFLEESRKPIKGIDDYMRANGIEWPRPANAPKSEPYFPAGTTYYTVDVVDALAHRGRFFRVLQQTERSQTAVMTIGPGEDGGPEEEHDGDQVLYVVEGEALVRIAGKEHRAAAGSLVMIPAR